MTDGRKRTHHNRTRYPYAVASRCTRAVQPVHTPARARPRGRGPGPAGQVTPHRGPVAESPPPRKNFRSGKVAHRQRRTSRGGARRGGLVELAFEGRPVVCKQPGRGPQRAHGGRRADRARRGPRGGATEGPGPRGGARAGRHPAAGAGRLQGAGRATGEGAPDVRTSSGPDIGAGRRRARTARDGLTPPGPRAPPQTSGRTADRAGRRAGPPGRSENPGSDHP
jgi:hypothetical protein